MPPHPPRNAPWPTSSTGHHRAPTRSRPRLPTPLNTQLAPETPPSTAIFAGVVAYIDGSTAPLVSDHRLRSLLVSHGARLAVRLARSVVTHVLLPPARAGRTALAAAKIEAEGRRRRVAGVRYVDARWVLESVEAGRRLPETRFAAAVGSGPVLRFGTPG
ncbi:hypothetical protein CDD80_1038 [Ophiocordyceps camponoti-rufipedis]|uniref:BRCT domain-containing protein n=1 Tax=Ophiocordyceps camponoti-rufipedis TaxID=2004952 RepID=A0A2C5ZBA4_9HYPO|nr:hypothetical protein CDD80_1038 [Ophiocordyceps camponoti-rufipedis]